MAYLSAPDAEGGVARADFPPCGSLSVWCSTARREDCVLPVCDAVADKVVAHAH